MTVRKEVVNPAGAVDTSRQFTFTPDNPALWLEPNEQTQGFFQLAHDAERVRCTDSTSQEYAVTESADALYTTTSSCTGDVGGTQVSSAGGSTVVFRPGPTQGEALVCAFINTRKTGSLRVEKALDPTSDAGRFDLQIDGVTVRANAGHGQGATSIVETGSHSVGELAGTGTSLNNYTSAIECRNAGGGLVKDGTGTSLSGIAIEESDQITCTITNRRANQPSPDSTAPTVTCSASPATLKSNNHRLAAITTSVTVTDEVGGSGAAGFTLVSVSSSQADSGLGGGDVPHDIQGWTTGTADTGGLLRTERYDSDRVYTLTYQASDNASNEATCQTTVTVRHGI